MHALENRLVDGDNCALTDLFDADHAVKVLEAFGRAFGKLPENATHTSDQQIQFIREAVADLSNDGKVVCVRLALFAEMMKGKSWTPATLRRVGGPQGVGVTFLEETFCASTAPPEHRLHERAARAVLKALLPQHGAPIKGQMKSYDELLQVSGYVRRPSEFADLIRILDREIRLITPTDPEGAEPEADWRPDLGPCQRHYQLAHDYLVPSVFDWLTRKQRSTLRGRTELRLAERTSLWNAHQEKKQLPTISEWLGIEFLTNRLQWTEAERRMMAAARWHRLSPLLACFCVSALIGAAAWGRELFGQWRAQQLVDALLVAETGDTTEIIGQMQTYRSWVNDPLYDALSDAIGNGDAQQALHFRLALLPTDRSQVAPVIEHLLGAHPKDLDTICNYLFAFKEEVSEPLWRILEQPDSGNPQRVMCSAAALVIFENTSSDRWDSVSETVVEALLDLHAEAPGATDQWVELLMPIHDSLRPALQAASHDDGTERKTAAGELRRKFSDDR
jgi:hypothetical protein